MSPPALCVLPGAFSVAFDFPLAAAPMALDGPAPGVVRRLLRRFASPMVTSAVVSLLLLALLASILSLTWREANQAEEVRRIYFADNISPAHRRVIDLFNRTHAGSMEVVPIDIPFEKFSTNERKELFARFLRSKSDQIDVFSVDVIWVPRFAKWCEPLAAHLTPAGREEILDVALRSCSYQDTLTTVPLFIDVAVLFYRQDLLRRLPDAARIEAEIQRSITWDRLLEVGRGWHSPVPSWYVYQADNYEGLLCSFVEAMEGRGQPLYEDGRFHLTSPEAVDALTFLRDLSGRLHVSPEGVTGFREITSVQFYLQNNGVFLRGWPTFPRDFRRLAPPAGIDVGAIRQAPLPHVAGHPPVSILGGWNLMISRYSAQKTEAAEFLRFLLTKEAQTILYEEGGYLPVNRRVYEDSALIARHADLRFYRELLRSGVRRPPLVEYTKYSDMLTRQLKRAIRGECTPIEALRRAEADIAADQSAQE
jgi:multiple sugar transport system substrate-binding protein